MQIPNFGENPRVRCFLCSESVPVRLAKTGKPYFICEPCGLQAFIRRERGMGKLLVVLDSPFSPKDSPGKNPKPNKVLELLTEIGAVRGKLAQVEANKRGIIADLLGPDDGSAIAVDALKSEIDRLEAKLNKITG